MYEEFTGLTYGEAKRYCTMPAESLKPHDRMLIGLMVKNAKENGGTVLDVGCGTGRIAKEFNISDYWGIDISPVIIKVARELNPGYKFQVMDAERITFRSNRFDNVLCGGVLPHIPTEKIVTNIIREMFRVCKRCGIVQVLWSTIPGETAEIRRVTGHFGRPTYQNRYRLESIVDAMPDGSRTVATTADGCALWKVQKI